MRRRFVGLVVFAAMMASQVYAAPEIQADPASNSDSQAEFATLQLKLEGLVSRITTDTRIDDINAVLGTRSRDWDQEHCFPGACTHIFGDHGGTRVPFGFNFYEFDSHFIIGDIGKGDMRENPPWITEGVAFQLALDPTVPAGYCFTESDWDLTLTRAGWEPFRPFTLDYGMVASDNPRIVDSGDFEDGVHVTLSVHGYATRRNGTYLALSSAGSDQLNRGVLGMDELANFRSLGPDCMRVVTLNGNAEQDYDAANAIQPSQPQ